MKKHDWRLDFVKIIAIIMVLYNHLYCYSFIFSYNVIIPGLSEPPVRTLRATCPENESHIFR